MRSASHCPPVRVGDWLVLPDQNRLERDGAAVEIEPKMMEVLVELTSRAGAVATRDDLRRMVWPDVLVGEDALNRCINQLRRVLGDDARSPRYIETISKKGYRLVAPVGHAIERGGDGSRTIQTVFRATTTGLLGQKAELVLQGCTADEWNAIKTRFRPDQDQTVGDFSFVWNGIRLYVETAVDSASTPSSVRIALRARSLLAASPILTGTVGFLIAFLVVFGNVSSAGVGAAIILLATLLGGLAGIRSRSSALQAERKTLAEFGESVVARLSDFDRRLEPVADS